MRITKPSLRVVLALLTIGTTPLGAHAAEYGFSSYALGGSAFGAGAMPPPGTYVTAVSGFYSGRIDVDVNFGNVTVSAGAKVDFFNSALNLLYVPQRTFLGGNLGLSVTIPVGHIDMEATVTSPVLASRSVDGWGLGDIVPKIQLGWHQGTFAHMVYLQAVAPTGRWDSGFAPNIGLHRPGVDVGWAFTLVDPQTKLQANATLGFTFNFENTATDYKSGNEFHLEWALGIECAPGFVLGLVGYDYRQISDDTGSAARPFRGSVDAIGAGLSYTTLVDGSPLVLSLRHYREFNVENRWDGSMTMATGTLRF